MHSSVKWFWLVVVISWLVTGCEPKPQTTIPMPTSEVIILQYTPGMQAMPLMFHQCSLQEDSNFAIVTQEKPTARLDPEQADLIFRLGAPEDLQDFSVIELGKEEMVFILNPANPISSLRIEQIRAIFTTQVTHWNEVDPNYPNDAEIQVWAFPLGEDLQLASSQILGGEPVAPSTFLAPDPSAMHQAIAESPSAIGILPMRWLDNQVKQLGYDTAPDVETSFPILMISENPPDGKTKSFALCLQDLLNKKE